MRFIMWLLGGLAAGAAKDDTTFRVKSDFGSEQGRKTLFADALVDAEEGEGEAHEEKDRKQIAREKRSKRNRQLQHAVWRKKIIDERDGHHVQKSATKRRWTIRARGPGRWSSGGNAALR